MADLIGIDVGYGYTKSFTLASGIQRRLVFPTAVFPYAPNVSFGVKIPTIRVDGKRFAVGEEIVINGLPYENTVREGSVASPSYMAVLGHVLSHTGFYGKAMVTGLSPFFFLTGGGSVNLFGEKMSGVIPVEDPQFANAMGFYEYGKQFLKS